LLPKERRLRKKKDFEYVFRHGKVLDRDALKVVWTKGTGRYAIIAGRSLGSLAYRNTIRRRWREGCRLLMKQGELPAFIDAILIIKTAGEKIRGEALFQELRETFKQIKP
jgi:ribonuclease P protein component